MPLGVIDIADEGHGDVGTRSKDQSVNALVAVFNIC